MIMNIEEYDNMEFLLKKIRRFYNYIYGSNEYFKMNLKLYDEIIYYYIEELEEKLMIIEDKYKIQKDLYRG